MRERGEWKSNSENGNTSRKKRKKFDVSTNLKSGVGFGMCQYSESEPKVIPPAVEIVAEDPSERPAVTVKPGPHLYPKRIFNQVP